ncbi:hypothetical protein F3Y22_tig00110260pilonHSYRG00141 [Hibiscus syriacus]|uniref:Uncharacterized protein n=1 Tax=Hibiscus syriacus TaxID=106335 RepID=A0A6A3B616_HIBSY|nr:hypothetical protein F3Y22_tig00110260pilonHSYRG00141 [Hibiscus syriacus]
MGHYSSTPGFEAFAAPISHFFAYLLGMTVIFIHCLSIIVFHLECGRPKGLTLSSLKGSGWDACVGSTRESSRSRTVLNKCPENVHNMEAYISAVKGSSICNRKAIVHKRLPLNQ